MNRDKAARLQDAQNDSGEEARLQSAQNDSGEAARLQNAQKDSGEEARLQSAQNDSGEAIWLQSAQKDSGEAAWIQDAQNGSEDALTRLIERHYHAIYAYFYKNTGQYHRSMDLTQEVFIKAAAGIARYRPRAPFQSWLFKIASNHLKNDYRALSRRPGEQELSGEVAQKSAAAFAESAAEECAVEQKSDLANALARLPPAQKEAVLLRFYHDFSVREISKITGAPQTTVKARIRYGLEKLKKELEGYDEEETARFDAADR